MANSLGIHPNHTGISLRKAAQSAQSFATAILCLIAFTALAMAQNPERDRAFDHGGIRVSHERMMTDFGGGNGGQPSPDAVCGEDSVAIGFHVQTGEFFNTAWLDCAHVRPDGEPGEEVRMTERTGTPGGRAVQDAFCPRGLVLRGLRGRTGASVDEAVGICSPLREIAERREHLRTEPTQAVVRPNANGHPAGAECPPGFVVTGFHSNAGQWMDHLWVLCSELRRGD